MTTTLLSGVTADQNVLLVDENANASAAVIVLNYRCSVGALIMCHESRD